VGRTALYRDQVPYRPARAEVQLESDVLVLVMPDGRLRQFPLDGVAATVADGCVAQTSARGSTPEITLVHGVVHAAPPRVLRRFVRMLVLERGRDREVVITPPDHGAVAPNVVSVPEAPSEAAVIEAHAWEALSDWLYVGGRLASCSIPDLARLACIATPQFAMLIGEVAAQRALEHVWSTIGPLRGGSDLDSALQPLTDAARRSSRANEALVSAISHVAGVTRRRRRIPRW
jgi:hypothetical protein